MKIVVLRNYNEVSKEAARIVAGEMKAKENIVLGLATGSTPIGLYDELARMCDAGEISFDRASSYNLDEYVGIELAHEQSYHRFMEEKLFSRVNFREGSTHVPYTDGADADADCAAYDEAVKAAGGIDVQILGIGGNGHIAFNEPDDVFTEETHITSLDERTIRDNARFFDSAADVPKQAITVGMGVIMGAKRIVIIATGENKADAVYKMVKGAVTPKVPASILRLHRDVVLLLDEAAASKLR